MSVFYFALESFVAESCRGKSGQDDVWLIVTVHAGSRISDVANYPVGFGLQAGQSLTGQGQWEAGPFALWEGETGIATYTLVNLGGSSQDDQALQSAWLGSSIRDAVTAALTSLSAGAGPGASAGGTIEAADAAIRQVFGGVGELTDPLLPVGVLDCRGLIGLHVAPFTAFATPTGNEVETSDPVTLTEAASTACGTPPRSTAVFSVRAGKNLFAKNAPIACLAGEPTTPGLWALPTTTMEVFAVALDGRVYRNTRTSDGSTGLWHRCGDQQFSATAPLLAVNRMTQWNDVFGTGIDGVIYNLRWTPAGGWPEEWSAVSASGEFQPETSLAVLPLFPALHLFALSPNGVVQQMSWNNAEVSLPWTAVGDPAVPPRTPLCVGALSRSQSVGSAAMDLEIYAVAQDGAMRWNENPAEAGWKGWTTQGSPVFSRVPGSTHLTVSDFPVFIAPFISPNTGLWVLGVDEAGHVLAGRWCQRTWTDWKQIAGPATTPSGRVSAVSGSRQTLYTVNAVNGMVQQSVLEAATPYDPTSFWSAWSPLPGGPVFDGSACIAAVVGVDVELFLTDVQGQMQRIAWSQQSGWGPWSLL